MLEVLQTRTGRAVTATALSILAVTATGCSSQDKPSKSSENSGSVTPDPSATGVVECAVQEANKWQAFPSNFDAPRAAGRLGVSEAQVAAGGLGPAHCETGITPHSIELGQLVSVKGMGEKCLAIGTQSPPSGDKPQQDILAICAAPLEQPIHTPSTAATAAA